MKKISADTLKKLESNGAKISRQLRKKEPTPKVKTMGEEIAEVLAPLLESHKREVEELVRSVSQITIPSPMVEVINQPAPRSKKFQVRNIKKTGGEVMDFDFEVVDEVTH